MRALFCVDSEQDTTVGELLIDYGGATVLDQAEYRGSMLIDHHN
jgi:hypothetical protein